ncbi:MAG: cell wall hydrolase [Clostridiales bacterium]|nr:cell wall hydrolase [Clostridiales bacterium]
MQRIKSMISSLCSSTAAMSASVFAVFLAIGIVTIALGGAGSSMTAYAETEALGEQQEEKDTEEEAAEYTEAKLEQQITDPESVREGEELLGETLEKVAEIRQETWEEQKSAVIEAKTKTQKIEEERARQAEEEAMAQAAEEAAAQAVSCSAQDYEVLQRIVEAEAGICDEKGKILVANVILNRVRSEKFPDTIAEVIYQNRQFSPVANGSIDRCTVTAETTQAVDRALAGEDYSEGALYFMNRTRSHARSVSWFDGRLTYLFRYEKHEFYK